jgi:hypothetical protein
LIDAKNCAGSKPGQKLAPTLGILLDERAIAAGAIPTGAYGVVFEEVGSVG